MAGKGIIRASLTRKNDVKNGRGFKLWVKSQLFISSVVRGVFGRVSEQQKLAMCR